MNIGYNSIEYYISIWESGIHKISYSIKICKYYYSRLYNIYNIPNKFILKYWMRIYEISKKISDLYIYIYYVEIRMLLYIK